MRSVRKYAAIFNTQMTNTLAYPLELVWRSLMIVLFVWIFTQLWRVTFAISGDSVISGLTLRDTIWYLTMTETLELARPRLARSIAESVRDGSIAYLLNKPYNFLLYHLSTSFGESLFRMFLNALLGGAAAWILVGAPPDPRGLPLVLVGVIGSFLISFCVSALIGLSAFVVEEVAPFEWIYQKIMFILGGLLIPLDFYPSWLQAVARYLPFSYTMYGPARLFIQPELNHFASLILGQLIWILVLGGVLGLAYTRGMRRLAINGG